MNTSRRSFLSVLAAAVAAPAIVRAESLMKLAPAPRLWADGIHCDADALSYWLSRPGFHLIGGMYLLSKPVQLRGAQDVVLRDAQLLPGPELREFLVLSGQARNVTLSGITFGARKPAKPIGPTAKLSFAI